jgi:A/G-specific adenine glycosylase
MTGPMTGPMTDPRPLDSATVLNWFRQHGRHDLPWQADATPYRVWVSEIMLQQTQVSTVIAYYQRFMQRFPYLQMLAAAPVDEVLHLWTGLGYYARARNLHKTAQLLCQAQAGEFPDSLEALEALPGIGRSTAGAILSLGMGQRGVILDGNVKRVLCRYYAINRWAGETNTLKHLWQLAELSTPASNVAHYTQAMMDLGATVCTRSKPDCTRCPLRSDCQALANNQVSSLPVSKPRKTLPVRQIYMLLCHQQHQVLLQQRPAKGIWGGLWSLPEFSDMDTLQAWASIHHARPEQNWPVTRHTFSHFHLDITPVPASANAVHIAEPQPGLCWYPLDHSVKLGLAAPVKKLLQQLYDDRLIPRSPDKHSTSLL